MPAPSTARHHIATFYLFTELDYCEDLQRSLIDVCARHAVQGTILVAPEGVNGTIAGAETGVEAVLDHLRSQPRMADLAAKRSSTGTQPFLRMKVRVKAEIVSLGAGIIDVANLTADRVQPAEWNELIAHPDVVLVDTRNSYETAIGTFDGAITADTGSFTDFPEWAANAPELADRPPVAMFCTGGIRCEKASAYLRTQGFDQIYQLDGGILRYLEQTSEEESTWRGDCYVFDRRVSVGHGLTPGDYEVCQNCNTALSREDRHHPSYEKGVVCSVCADTTSEQRRQRFVERQRQIDLAEARGERHLGSVQA